MRLLTIAALAALTISSAVRAREFHVAGGVLIRGLAPVVRAVDGGCFCEKGPPGGQCCTFQGRVPNPGSGERAPCHCRACRPAYRCAKRKTATYCVPKREAYAPRLLGLVYRPGAAICINKRITSPVLMPRPPAGLKRKRKLKIKKKWENEDDEPQNLPGKRVNRRNRHRLRRRSRYGRRPKSFSLFVAGGAQCWVYQGSSRRVILRTRRGEEVVIYRRERIPLHRCTPIRIKCAFARRGVLLAIKAGGRFFGSGMQGSRCKISSRRPRDWHSAKPRIRDETQVIRNIQNDPASWQEFTELTNARPIRSRRKPKLLFTYIVFRPPLCGKDFDGPIV